MSRAGSCVDGGDGSCSISVELGGTSHENGGDGERGLSRNVIIIPGNIILDGN